MTMPPDGEVGYNFSLPVEFGGESSFLQELISTPAFQRLKHIRFLGGIDYALVRAPNGRRPRYSRYQHSLGVARLANHHANLRDYPRDERNLSVVAALLHDIGHAPLSHSLEVVFNEFFGIEHHSATEQIITGEAQIGRAVNDILRKNTIDVDRLLFIVSGRDSSFDEFFSVPINFDTIDGILRCHSYLRKSPATPNPDNVVKSASTRYDSADRDLVDSFWQFKDII